MGALKNKIGWWLLLFMVLSVSCASVTSKRKQAAVVAALHHRASLNTVQYNVRKILTYEDFSTLDGTLFFEKFSIQIPGDRKIALPVDVIIKSSIDLSAMTAADVEVKAGEITLLLPDPKLEISSSAIDYSREMQFLSWNRSKFSEAEKEGILKSGEQKILQEMSRADVMARSLVAAYKALIPLLEAAGYASESVTICFRSDLKDDTTDDSIMDMLQGRRNL